MKKNYVESEYAYTWLEDDIIYQVIKSHLDAFNIIIAKQLVEDRVKASNSTIIRPYALNFVTWLVLIKKPGTIMRVMFLTGVYPPLPLW
jgi:hypothetical protein